jgi:hypothetical protein
MCVYLYLFARNELARFSLALAGGDEREAASFLHFKRGESKRDKRKRKKTFERENGE